MSASNAIASRRRRSGNRSRTAKEPRGSRFYDLLACLLLITPVAAGTILFGGARFWSVGPLSVLVFIGVGLLALKPLLFKNLREAGLFRPPGWYLFCAFAIYAFLRIPFSSVPFDAQVEAVTLAGYLAAFWGWSRWSNAGRRSQALLAFFLLLTSGLCWYAIIQHAGGSNLVLNLPRPEQYGMRFSATYMCPNHFAHLVVLSILVAGGLLTVPLLGWPLRILCVYTLLLAPPVLLMTESRSAWLGLAAGICVMVSILAMRKGVGKFLLSLVAVPAVLAVVAYGLWTLSPRFHERVQEVMHGNMRVQVWEDTGRIIQEKPLLGHGPGSFRWQYPFHKKAYKKPSAYPRYAHNEFLNSLVDFGILGTGILGAGLVAWVLTLLGYLRSAHRDYDAVLAAVAIGCVAASLAHAMFDFNLHLFANAHLLVLLCGTAAGRMMAHGRRMRPAWPVPTRLASGLGVAVCLVLAIQTVRLSGASICALRAGKANEQVEYDKALEWCRIAPSFHPGHAQIFQEQGGALVAQAVWVLDLDAKDAKARSALEAFNRALGLNPYDLLSHYGKSRAYSLLGQYQESLDELERILERAPNHFYYLKQLGIQLRLLGRDEEALKAFQRAQKVDRNDETVRMNIQALKSKLTPPKMTKKSKKPTGKSPAAPGALSKPAPAGVE